MATAMTSVQQSWINWATSAFEEQNETYQKYEDYYVGEHPLEFATDKWVEVFGDTFEEFSDNWCQVVVDAVAQRMRITGWKSESDKDKEAADVAEEIWDESSVYKEEDDLYIGALTKGDGYMICWPSPEETDKIDLYYNDALNVEVFYDPSNIRRIAAASKKWEDLEGNMHLRLYFPDRIESYVIPNKLNFQPGLFQMVSEFRDEDAPLPSGWERLAAPIPNPYGQVPVFHFKNRRGVGSHGMSEIKIVIPIQNAINKMLMDMMLASEFAGFRQLWMTGSGQPKDGWKAGPYRVWASTDKDAKFGSIQPSDLEQFVAIVEMMVGHVAKVTQTPMHYLRPSGDMPSGEALRTAESGLVKKCLSRQRQWGWTWGDAMTFAVGLRLGREVTGVLRPVWEDPETRHDLEQAQTAQLKSVLGIPLEHLWAEHFGYTQEEIDLFLKMNKAVAAQVLAQVIAQAGQLPPGMGQIDPNQVIQLIRDQMSSGNGQSPSGFDLSQILALLPKSVTAQTTAGETTEKPQPNTSPSASPTRRSTGFKD